MSKVIPVAWQHEREPVTPETLTPDRLIPLRLERREGLDGVSYSITHGGFNLNKQGEWEYEPIPSERAKAFYKRCRWAKFEDALAIFEKLDPRGRMA